MTIQSYGKGVLFDVGWWGHLNEVVLLSDFGWFLANWTRDRAGVALDAKSGGIQIQATGHRVEVRIVFEQRFEWILWIKSANEPMSLLLLWTLRHFDKVPPRWNQVFRPAYSWIFLHKKKTSTKWNDTNFSVELSHIFFFF